MHLSTCGRDCTGEPRCSEVADVVSGISDDERRRKYGALAIDVQCPQCKAAPGVVCEGCSGPNHYHAVRGMAAQAARAGAYRATKENL